YLDPRQPRATQERESVLYSAVVFVIDGAFVQDVLVQVGGYRGRHESGGVVLLLLQRLLLEVVGQAPTQGRAHDDKERQAQHRKLREERRLSHCRGSFGSLGVSNL